MGSREPKQSVSSSLWKRQGKMMAREYKTDH